MARQTKGTKEQLEHKESTMEQLHAKAAEDKKHQWEAKQKPEDDLVYCGFVLTTVQTLWGMLIQIHEVKYTLEAPVNGPDINSKLSEDHGERGMNWRLEKSRDQLDAILTRDCK